MVAFSASLTAFGSGADESAFQGAIFSGDSSKFHDAVFSGGPRRLSLGVALQQQNRTMQEDNGRNVDWELNHFMATVGVDLAKWLTIYGGLGQADLSIDKDDRDADGEWMGGAQLRILNYMVLEPWYGDDLYWVGINADSFVRSGSAESGARGESVDWTEVFGSLTCSLTAKPTRAGLVDRVGIYGGPAVSLIDAGQDFGGDLESDQAVGFIAGIQVNPNPHMGLRFELQQFDALGLGGSFTFHF